MATGLKTKEEAPVETGPTPPNPEMRVESVKARGTTYWYRELSAIEYDELVKQATSDDDVDVQLLSRLMTLKSVMQPELDAEEWATKPMPLVRKVQQAVTSLHWAGDEDDEGNS